MLLVQYGYIFLVLIFLLLFSSPKGSENKETKISELGKYISYCTLSRAITITYYGNNRIDRNECASTINLERSREEINGISIRYVRAGNNCIISVK